MEVLSGMAFDEYLKEKLFGPLGMVAAEFRCPLKMFSCRIGHAFVLLRPGARVRCVVGKRQAEVRSKIFLTQRWVIESVLEYPKAGCREGCSNALFSAAPVEIGITPPRRPKPTLL